MGNDDWEWRRKVPKRTVGEELHRLFKLRDRGKIAPHEFQRRKEILLKCTQCELSAFMPDRQAATRTAVIATAGIVLLAIVMIAVGHGM